MSDHYAPPLIVERPFGFAVYVDPSQTGAVHTLHIGNLARCGGVGRLGEMYMPIDCPYVDGLPLFDSPQDAAAAMQAAWTATLAPAEVMQ